MLLAIPHFEADLRSLGAGSESARPRWTGFRWARFRERAGAIQRLLQTLDNFRAENYGDNPFIQMPGPLCRCGPLRDISAKLEQWPAKNTAIDNLDNFTDDISKALLATARTADGPPLVAKVTRTGSSTRKFICFYSQERLASYGLKPSNLQNILNARNITAPGGQLTVGSKSVGVNPSGEFHSEVRSAM